MGFELNLFIPRNISKNMVVFKKVKLGDLSRIKGFLEEEVKSVYEERRLRRKGVILVLYTSGKLLLQGKQHEVDLLAEELGKFGIGEEVKPIRFRKEIGVFIGSDESLKGDTFGGIVVAAVKADDSIREKLREIGVADSKKLSDKEILVMAGRIRMLAECEIRNIFPIEYNGNKQTVLLNKLHKECGEYLKPGQHVVDKYPGCRVGDIREEKAEDKYVEVAAASVLARATALRQLDTLSMKAGFHLPKGSSHVKLALHELKERKLNFKEFVKVDFRNVKEYL